MPRVQKPLTEQERAERRRADREFARQAVERLRNSEGWQAWLATRRHFHGYSLTNQLLIAMQHPRRHPCCGVSRLAEARLLRTAR